MGLGYSSGVRSENLKLEGGEKVTLSNEIPHRKPLGEKSHFFMSGKQQIWILHVGFRYSAVVRSENLFLEVGEKVILSNEISP
jgi:hypothetical protein